jgi:[acyl-carrier-protein] S-malonyltransferase
MLFPGQASQTPEMRDTVAAAAPHLLELVVAVCGEDPFPRVEEGTAYAQPAIFCASLAGWTQLGRPEAEYLAGHSLGELGALVAAGCLTERDGLELVALRGRLMQEACETAGAGGMVAVMGAEAAERAPELAAAHGLEVANDNSPQQVVLSGRREVLESAAEAARALGLRGIVLPVTGAFHSEMMRGAVTPFTAALDRVEVHPPSFGQVFSAVSAEPFEDVRAQLVEALTSPVRWREVMLSLYARGADRFVEMGPGKVLTGLAKRTLRDVELAHA